MLQVQEIKHELFEYLRDKYSDDVLLVNSISALNLGARGKDIVFMWILELLLFHTPYPNKIITHTLANIISDISTAQAFGFLDWSQREKMN